MEAETPETIWVVLDEMDGWIVIDTFTEPVVGGTKYIRADINRHYQCPVCGDRILKPGHCYNPYCPEHLINKLVPLAR